MTISWRFRIMSEVIKRLRESKKKHEQKMREKGRAAGRAWAEKSADYSELKNLERFWPETDTSDFGRSLDASAYTFSEMIA
jgi:hypothetical protein